MSNSGNKNKVVLVTGSATGVGRACALHFAKEGYDVVVNYPGTDEVEANETVKQVNSFGVESLLVKCDVSRNDQVQQMACSIRERYEKIDVLVNNAGKTYFVEHSNLDEMSEAMWDEILAVNTKGPFLVTRACLSLLRASDNAAIVNVSSAAGITGYGSSIAYCASKGGLNTMTKSLAKCLAPGIRVNAVCPGPIDSRWLRNAMTEEEIQERAHQLPLAKLAHPDDIADTVFYLAAGTTMTTGQLLVVDGGRTV
ncbi:MAG: SDR family oxidoreductase [Planctomycetota bacterium]|nr:SDR family oxidoreductase [Planctomycetota bacterium]